MCDFEDDLNFEERSELLSLHSSLIDSIEDKLCITKSTSTLKSPDHLGYSGIYIENFLQSEP